MEVWHRIGFNAGISPSYKSLVERLEIEHKIAPLPGNVVGVVVFSISESDPRWIVVDEQIDREYVFDVYTTVFTNEEILAAEWVRLIPLFEQGYPQPEDTWKQFTYEGICSQCGAGYQQKAPFRLKKEPRMGRQDFFSFYWAYTFFGLQRVVRVLEAQQLQGFEVWPAILHRANQPSTAVAQLIVPGVAKPGLADEDKVQPETCVKCGITKYLSQRRGYMHFARNAINIETDFQMTHEWFGSGGHIGYREFIISQRVAKLILEKEWRGVTLKPIKLV